MAAQAMYSCQLQGDVVARDAGILISLLLQHGCAIGVIANAISRDADGSPSGVIGAVLDLIAERP
jgi:hypothetical protein